MAKMFARQRSAAVEAVDRKVTKLWKAAPDRGAIESSVLAAINAQYDSSVADIEAALVSSWDAGAERGFQDLQVNTRSMIVESQELARAQAKARAAELVGRKWIDGVLVENPNAKWAISETTRDEIRRLVEDAFTGETPIATLKDSIRDADAFSDSRAAMIARTEVVMAQSQATYAAWAKTGVAATIRWHLSAIHPDTDECDANADADPVPFGEAFPSGDLHPPSHPRCLCSCSIATFNTKSKAV